MLKLTQLQWFKIITFYILLAIVAYICYNIKYLLTPAKKRPFQCSDKSLAQPFVDDTVSTDQLYILGIYFPIGVIIICELLKASKRQKSVKMCLNILQFILRTIIIETLFLVGLTVERLYKNVAKIKMARLRPHFITVCKPVNSMGWECSKFEEPEFINEYECSASSYPDWAVTSTFASFPSGHTSLTAYGMMFLICYLYLLVFKLRHSKSFLFLLILIMQVLCFFTIMFVAVSRVLDFKHHWSDVGAGFIGGSFIAMVINYYLKQQWENIENWLGEIVSNSSRDIEATEEGRVGSLEMVCDKIC